MKRRHREESKKGEKRRSSDRRMAEWLFLRGNFFDKRKGERRRRERRIWNVVP